MALLSTSQRPLHRYTFFSAGIPVKHTLVLPVYVLARNGQRQRRNGGATARRTKLMDNSWGTPSNN